MPLLANGMLTRLQKKHGALKANIFREGELTKDSVISILENTATDGKRYRTMFYNLDAILSVGYRVNSVYATQFRQWATGVLRN